MSASPCQLRDPPPFQWTSTFQTKSHPANGDQTLLLCKRILATLSAKLWDLHFDCVDDVLNMRVRNLSRLFLRLSDRHLNDHLSD